MQGPALPAAMTMTMKKQLLAALAALVDGLGEGHVRVLQVRVVREAREQLRVGRRQLGPVQHPQSRWVVVDGVRVIGHGGVGVAHSGHAGADSHVVVGCPGVGSVARHPEKSQ